MADKKDEKKEEKAVSNEILSNNAAAFIVIALLILAGTIMFGNGTPGVSQTPIAWKYSSERFWERGKYDSAVASNIAIEPNFVSFSFYGEKLIRVRCIGTDPRSSRLTCSYSESNGKLRSGPDRVYLKKLNDFLYEGQKGYVLYKGNKYRNIKIRLERN